MEPPNYLTTMDDVVNTLHFIVTNNKEHPNIRIEAAKVLIELCMQSLSGLYPRGSQKHD